MKEGLISVIMGVHNEKEEYLRLSVKSILNQTYKNLEFLIIDDYSEPECEQLLNEISSTDSRIRLYRNDTNLGLTKTLNKGLALADGEYIARMDADDFSTSDRFDKQLTYFKQHPDIDILGGGVVSFGNECKFYSPAFGYSNEEAQCNLFFQSTLCHPSVMIKQEFLTKHDFQYDENVKNGQDYDMWERCSVLGKLAVMKDVVLYYRTHSGQITSTNREDQNSTARLVRRRRLRRIGLVPTEQEYKCHMMLLGDKDSTVHPEDVKAWMIKVLQANEKYQIADPAKLQANLKIRFVLYKARNGKSTISDFPVIVKTVIDRIKMNLKISKVNKSISDLMK